MLCCGFEVLNVTNDCTGSEFAGNLWDGCVARIGHLLQHRVGSEDLAMAALGDPSSIVDQFLVYYVVEQASQACGRHRLASATSASLQQEWMGLQAHSRSAVESQ